MWTVPTSSKSSHPSDPGFSYRKIKLDTTSGQIYWTANDATDSIQRANLDGSNQERLLSGFGLALGFDVDLGSGKLYWANGSNPNPSMQGSIHRSNLDGSDVETIIPDLDIASFSDLPGLALSLASAGSGLGWATHISAGPGDDGQALTFVVLDNSHPDLFEVGPAIRSDGILTYTPAANANGIAVVTVILQDDGGTANEGMDTVLPSPSRSP